MDVQLPLQGVEAVIAQQNGANKGLDHPVCHATQPALCHTTQPALCHTTQPALCHTTQPALCHTTQPALCHTTQPALCHTTQPLPNGTIREHIEPPSEEVPSSVRTEDVDSDDSLTDSVSTNDVCRLLPNHTSTNPHKMQKEEPAIEDPSYSPKTSSPKTLANRASSHICTPPSASTGPKGWNTPQSPKCNGHVHPNKKRLPSTTKSQQSFKADAAQIQEVAGDDCCVHCVLACLFCEVLSVCSVMAQCLACGQGCEALCCCGEGASEGLACGEDTCSTLLDCGIMEDCCDSSDCLEICLECCSICFPA